MVTVVAVRLSSRASSMGTTVQFLSSFHTPCRRTFDPALVPRELPHSADEASVTYGGHDRASDIRCCTFSVPGQQWQRSHLRLRYRTLCMASQRLRCRPHRGDGRSDHRASERVSPGGQNRSAARSFSWLSGSLPSLACRVASWRESSKALHLVEKSKLCVALHSASSLEFYHAACGQIWVVDRPRGCSCVFRSKVITDSGRR